MTEYRTPEQWRPDVVERYGELSPPTLWIDELIRDGKGNVMAAADRVIWEVLRAINAGEVE